MSNKSDELLSDEQLAIMKEECYSIYEDCMRKYTKMLPYLHFASHSFHSKSGFLTFTNKDDYKLYTEHLKNLSDALEPIRKHFGIR